MTPKFLAFASALLLAVSSFAQNICGLGDYQDPCTHGGCMLMADTTDKFTFVPPPADFVFGETRAATITVVYSGFTTAAQNAFQYAVDIWAANITSSENIIIDANFTTLGSGVLGSAGPTTIQRNFSGAPQLGVWYPSALANSLAGTDLSPGQPDVSCWFNDSFNWYYGTDGNCPGGQYDFVSVVLHELGHGLGFVGSANYSGGVGFLGSGGNNYVYDTFVENIGGTDITSFGSGTTELGSQLVGNALYWNGAEGTANNGGNRPRLYAPAAWNGGSSFSHLNEGTYPSGNENSLMTPQIGSAEAIHTPGPITYGMFIDMAWQVGGCAITDVTVSTQFACNPSNNTYSQQIILTYENGPASGFIDINGNLFPVFNSPQLITINGLEADGQPVDLDISFTNFPSCTTSLTDVWTAPAPCCSDVRLDSVNPVTGDFVLKNWGSCEIDISNYILSATGTDALVGTLAVISGDLSLATNETVTLNWASLTDPGDLAVYNPGANTVLASGMIDYVQWGAAGQPRQGLAASVGLWSTGDFLDGLAPFTFIGDAGDHGASFWEVTPPPCNIDGLITGVQSACDPETDTYTQELIFNYTSAPASGQMDVNGTLFSFSGATSQGVFLGGLVSDGLPVDVTVSFTAEPGCTATFPAAFVAPESCANNCPLDLTGDDQVDVQDVLFVLGDFGCLISCVGDVTGDGPTNTADVLMVVGEIGTLCE